MLLIILYNRKIDEKGLQSTKYHFSSSKKKFRINYFINKSLIRIKVQT